MKEVSITKNFLLSEFNCKCGCIMPLFIVPHIITVANQLQVLRDHVSKPIFIVSGYRCLVHNLNVGGVKNSYHPKGMAADIKIPGIPPKDVFLIIEDLQDGFFMKLGGLRAYRSFTHYDTRGSRKRW
jgi:uncharacterized protein YcbK (DUF882 family)